MTIGEFQRTPPSQSAACICVPSVDIEIKQKGAYVFSSTPRALYHNKKLQSHSLPANIMHDKRVIRGNTYSKPHVPEDLDTKLSRLGEARRRQFARHKANVCKKRAEELKLQRLKSPLPVPGRVHAKIQTEEWLEIIFEKPLTADKETQTDFVLDRPASPFAYPKKVGIDTGTQIYEGDLFDFDMEVIPIVEVLVMKTIEQALVEVLEEEELMALREQQQRFLEIRAAELAEALRLEEREMRVRAEKERRIQEFDRGCSVQKETEARVAGAVLMQGYMLDLLPSVLEGLKESGFLFDNIKDRLEDSYMPWLMNEVSETMNQMVCSRDILSEMIRDITENVGDIYRALYEIPEEPSVYGFE